MPTPPTKIQFIDIPAQKDAMGEHLANGLQTVLEHCRFVFGPEVSELEQKLAARTGAPHVVTCNSGTDALMLLLMAKGIGPNDAVFVPPFTFAATAEVVALLNATPIFVDICPETYNIDPESLKAAYAEMDRNQLTPRGIIAVDLFGLPADYNALQSFADQNGLWLIADAAQSFGGAIGDSQVGNLTEMTATSFFPSKPLACFGDGGAIFTRDEAMAAKLCSLRNHGHGEHRYDYIHIGMNSRLDSMQAAILLAKLEIFDQEWQRRNQVANLYQQHLQSLVKTPITPENYQHAWGLYTIACQDKAERDYLAQYLSSCDIPTNVYYHSPLHQQKAYQHFPCAQSLKVTELAANTVLSLPMHPYLTDDQLFYIVDQIKRAYQ